MTKKKKNKNRRESKENTHTRKEWTETDYLEVCSNGLTQRINQQKLAVESGRFGAVRAEVLVWMMRLVPSAASGCVGSECTALSTDNNHMVHVKGQNTNDMKKKELSYKQVSSK